MSEQQPTSDNITSDNITSDQQEGGRFGLTAAEYRDVITMLKMGGAIFLAVSVALVVVALAAGALGI